MALTLLPNGVCVDPDTVKIINIRGDRQGGPQGVVVYNVVMRTDADDGWIVIGSFDNRAEAEKLSAVCARRINGESDEPEAPEAAPAKPATPAAKPKKADDDDDW